MSDTAFALLGYVPLLLAAAIALAAHVRAARAARRIDRPGPARGGAAAGRGALGSLGALAWRSWLVGAGGFALGWLTRALVRR